MDAFRLGITPVVRQIQACAKIVSLHWTILEGIGLSGADPQLAEQIVSALEAADGASSLLTHSVALRGAEAVRGLIRVVGALSGLVEGLRMVVDALIRHAPRTDVTNYGSRSSSGVDISSGTLVKLVEAQDSSLSNVGRLEGLVGEPLHPLLVSAVSGELEVLLQGSEYLDAFLQLQLPTVELPAYAAVLQHMLETLKGDSVRRILQRVEVLRTQVLGVPLGRRPWPARYPLIQRLIQTYRLTPSEPLQPLRDLLAALCPELAADRSLAQIGKLVRQPTQLLAALERLSAATTQHVGFLVWNLGGPNPKLHGYRMLVDREYLTGLLGGASLEAGEGVSPKYLAATATIADLPPNPVPEYFLRTEGPCTHWIVLETPGESGWRYRRPWSGESPLIPHHWLEGLDDPQAAPSPRIQNYNSALEGEILSHLQAPYMTYQQLTRDEVVREELYWRNLREKIRRVAMVDWTRRAGKVGAARVAETLRAGDFYARLVSHVVDEIVLAEAAPEALGPAAQQMLGRELQISYAQQVDRIREGLRGVVEGAAITIGRSAKGAKQTPEEVWSAAIEEGLARYISRRNNVYLLLDTKSQLLQRTLVRA